MKNGEQWLLIDPLDTLFLRGSEPMIAGESHEVRSVFPPMPATLCGAIRSAILQQRGINPQRFAAQEGSDAAVLHELPLLGTPEKPGFKIAGPLLLARMEDGTEWLYPVPACCFGPSNTASDAGDLELTMAEVFPDCGRIDGLCGNVESPFWVKNPGYPSMKSMTGCWTNVETLKRLAEGAAVVETPAPLETAVAGRPILARPEAVCGNEPRVGIAMETKVRRARQGHLYSAYHVRLHSNIALAVGVSEHLVPGHLDACGILQLGGEQRIVRYELLQKGPPLRPGTSRWVMALSPFPIAELKALQWENYPRASGPLIRMGGWDMKKSFHKPMKDYLPAGTVIVMDTDAPVPFGFVRL